MALAVHKFITDRKIPFTTSVFKKNVGSIVGVLLTFHFVCFCWIFFRASNMETAWQMIIQITQNFKPELFLDFLIGYKGVILLMTIGYTLHGVPQKIEWMVQEQVTRAPIVAKAALVTLVILIVVQVKSAGIQPFIYFQF